MKDIITDRNKRLFTASKNQIWNKDLIVAHTLSNKIINELKESVKIFIADCLSTFYRKSYELTLDLEEFIKANDNEIIGLPNITPNGLMLPKKEVLASYNLLLKRAVAVVEYLGLDKSCLRAACPINLRINFGARMSDYSKNRPKSSTWWHTDIWAGQNSRDVILHTPIFGDFCKNGLLVAPPPEGFFPNFVRTLDSFQDGVEIADKLTGTDYNPLMKIGESYLVDSFLMHKTLNSDDNLRGIISFPLQIKELLKSDIYHNHAREPEYLDMEEWSKLGTRKFVSTSKKMEKFEDEDVSKNVYADRFELVNLY